jgi:hypothetical protein
MSVPSLSWSRVLVEGTAVVLSILLAFAIDAAWEERQQRRADVAQLRGLLDELATHKRLLAEASANHRRTVVDGFELLGILTGRPDPKDIGRISVLLNSVMDFYRINAPFGALETAIASGTLSRMQNVDLATRLASWPTAIEDLMEEQETGGTVLNVELFSALGAAVSLRDVYRLRFENPSGRGTGQVVEDVANVSIPDGMPAPDYSALYGNVQISNQLMYYLMMAQGSEAESVLADRQLDTLMETLTACLDTSAC